MKEAALASGWQVMQLESWRPPEALAGRTDVIAYGEPLFVAAMAEFLGLSLLEPHFDWLPRLPQTYTKRAVTITTLERARSEKERIFAKPADDKCFSAGVYSSGKDIKASDLLPTDIPVLISEIVDWKVEYRFFILYRQPQTFSIYLRNGELDFNVPPDTESEEAFAFVQTIFEDTAIQMPPGVVLDVGFIEGRGWAILEANPAFGAGVYLCDPVKVLPVLSRCVIAASELSDDDKRWVIQRA
ncbi:MAG: ATP-grasp domain-containing protein [Cyanobacteria bacterium TGS_CYA1]|nr:ATP-grasp domain-containing protein [Cyanobacteria bacterium TGS_CYA1]